jgi:hypothetical protein
MSFDLVDESIEHVERRFVSPFFDPFLYFLDLVGQAFGVTLVDFSGSIQLLNSSQDAIQLVVTTNPSELSNKNSPPTSQLPEASVATP